MTKTKIACLVCVALIGIGMRIGHYHTRHPDKDELFQLKSLQTYGIRSVFKNDSFYGDHTSFPGEYLLAYFPMRSLGLLRKNAKIDLQKMMVEGITKKDFYILNIPHIIISVIGMLCFFWLCFYLKHWQSILLAMGLYFFNVNLIYHEIAFRPYAVLPDLFMIVIVLCTIFAEEKTKRNWILFTLLSLFTLIYHAYGIILVLLPILYFRKLRTDNRVWIIFLIGLAGWANYASYNTFGMIPNDVQSQMDPFSYMPKNKFGYLVILNIFGGSTSMMVGIPIVIGGLLLGQNIKGLASFVIIPIILIIIINIITKYGIHPRQFLFTMPIFAIFCGQCLDKILGKLK